jgi:hypothetical protein
MTYGSVQRTYWLSFYPMGWVTFGSPCICKEPKSSTNEIHVLMTDYCFMGYLTTLVAADWVKGSCNIRNADNFPHFCRCVVDCQTSWHISPRIGCRALAALTCFPSNRLISSSKTRAVGNTPNTTQRTVHRPGDDPRKECEECGNARGSNVRYYPKWKHSPLKGYWLTNTHELLTTEWLKY